MGHFRPISHVRAMSVMHPKASKITDIAGTVVHTKPKGRASLLCPESLEVDLLCYRESVINLDAEISDSALYLRVAKQELYSSQRALWPAVM